MDDYAVRLLTRMLEIYSPSGKEEEISTFLAREMKQSGFNVHRDVAGNVIGEVGHGKPTVLLCGHMDTVEGHIPVKTENGNMYGRGAVDAKASLAAMIVASSIMAQEGLSNTILLAGVVDEERTGKGIKQLIRDRISPDYALFGEPSGVEKLTIGYKGSLRLKITCNTQAGHSSAPWLYENAIEKSFELWRAIKRIHLEKEKLGSHFYSISSSLIRVNGGRSSSTIPSMCDIYTDFRFPPQITSEEVHRAVLNVIEMFQAVKRKVSVKVSIMDMTEPYEVETNSPLVRALSWSIRKVRHKSPTLLRKTGTGDMNVFGKSMKIPVVTYGPGDSHLDHTSKESIDISEYLDSIAIFTETISKLVSFRKNCG